MSEVRIALSIEAQTEQPKRAPRLQVLPLRHFRVDHDPRASAGSASRPSRILTASWLAVAGLWARFRLHHHVGRSPARDGHVELLTHGR